MAREQGDFLGDEVKYQRKNADGEMRYRNAYTPADEINLQARGWVKSAGNSNEAAPSGSVETATPARTQPAQPRPKADSSQKDSGAEGVASN